MTNDYDVIVIGGGLGGLTAAALTAQAGRRTLLIERNHEIGGAASSYQVGNLFVYLLLRFIPFRCLCQQAGSIIGVRCRFSLAMPRSSSSTPRRPTGATMPNSAQ